MMPLDDVVVQLILDNFHELLIKCLPDDGMAENQRLYPEGKFVFPQFFQYVFGELIPLGAATLVFVGLLDRRSDVDIDLVVHIVVDADIDVEIGLFLGGHGLEVFVSKFENSAGGHHDMLVVYFGLNECLFYLARRKQPFEHIPLYYIMMLLCNKHFIVYLQFVNQLTPLV